MAAHRELWHKGLQRRALLTRKLGLGRTDHFAFDPGPASRTYGHPRALSQPITTWTKWPSQVYFVTQSKWPFRDPFALPSQSTQGREIDLMEKCRNEASRSGVCRCQIRAYDKNAEGPARPLLADETSGTLLFPTKRPSITCESGSCRSSHWSHKVGDLFRAFLEPRRSAVPFSGVVNGPRQGWAAGSDRFWPRELRVSRTFLDFLPIICTVHGYPGRRAAVTADPAIHRDRDRARGFEKAG